LNSAEDTNACTTSGGARAWIAFWACSAGPATVNVPISTPSMTAKPFAALISVAIAEPEVQLLCGVRAHPVNTAPLTINPISGQNAGTSHSSTDVGTSIAMPSRLSPISTRAWSIPPVPRVPRKPSIFFQIGGVPSTQANSRGAKLR
jgi:hypothetical protein